MRKIFLITLVVVLLCLLPIGASAVIPPTNHNISTDTDLDVLNPAVGDTITVLAGSTLRLYSSNQITHGNIAIICQSNVNLTVDDIGIDCSASNAAPSLNFTGGTNTLTLSGSLGSGFNSASGYAGVNVPLGVDLTIKGSGMMSAHGWGGGAGIGGNANESAGNITICLDAGGEIFAYGSDNGSINDANTGTGIGGGWNGAGTTIIFCDNNQGHVEAYGGFQAAGIGGGFGSVSGDITIGNGELKAVGGGGAAGIGGGNGGRANNITIKGGYIDATGGLYGAGIGGGSSSAAEKITITGGEVTATGGSTAAGIGGGRLAPGLDIQISGGRIYARSLSGGIAQDIGTGQGGGPSTIVLSSTADVFVENQSGIATALPYQSLSSNPPGYNVPAGWAYPINFYGTLDVITNPQTGYSSWFMKAIDSAAKWFCK